MLLVIGNKNYSSWSMRAGVLLRALGLPFEERVLRLGFGEDSPFRRAVAEFSPAGKVPVLRLDDGFAVWDTLAIAETLADRFPQAGVWPADANARARARSLAAEMHSGFGALRSHCPMNVEASLPEVGARLLAEQPGVAADRYVVVAGRGRIESVVADRRVLRALRAAAAGVGVAQRADAHCRRGERTRRAFVDVQIRAAANGHALQDHRAVVEERKPRDVA